MIRCELKLIKEEDSPINQPSRKSSEISKSILKRQMTLLPNKRKLLRKIDTNIISQDLKKASVLELKENNFFKKNNEPEEIDFIEQVQRYKSGENLEYFEHINRGSIKKKQSKKNSVEHLTIEQVKKDLKKPYLTFSRKNTIDTRRIKNLKRMATNILGGRKSEKLLNTSYSSNSQKPLSRVQEKEGVDRKKSSLLILEKYIKNSSDKDSCTSNRISNECLLINRKYAQMQSNHNKKTIFHTVNEVSNMSNDSNQQCMEPIENIPENLNLQSSFKSGKINQDRKEKDKWQKFFAVYSVVTSVLFIRREIAKYGVVPSIKNKICNTSIENSCDNNNQSNTIAQQLNYSFKPETLKNLTLRKKKMKQNKIPSYLIPEDNKYLSYWNSFMILILLNTIIVMPFRMSFTDNFLNPSYNIFYFDICIEFFYLVDFVRTFFTSYTNKHGMNQTSLLKIFLNYLHGWLLIDLISISPIYLLENSDSENTVLGGNSGLTFLFRIPKLYRLFRLTKFLKLTKALNSKTFLNKLEKSIGINKNFLKLFSFFLTITIVCHIFGCMWYYLAKFEHFDPNTWIHRYDLLDEDIFLIYLKSLYFAFTSFITLGYGDITAFSNLELIVVILWLYIAGIYYSFSLSNLGNIFNENNLKSVEIRNKFMLIEEISKNNNFDKNLEDRLKNYIENLCLKDENYDDIKSILTEIPNKIKSKISLSMFDKRIMKIELFKKSNKNFIANVVPLLKYQSFTKDEIIYKCDEVPQKVFFILLGNVSLMTADGIVYTRTYKGNYFGEIEILKKTYRDSTAISNCFTETLTMNKKILFEEVTEEHTEFFNILVETMIEKFNLYENIKHCIDVIIEEGMTLFYNSQNEDPKHFSKLSNIEFFNVGLKNRIANPIPVESNELNSKDRVIHFETSKKNILLKKRKNLVRRRSLKRKTVGVKIMKKLKDECKIFTVEKQDHFELLNTKTCFNSICCSCLGKDDKNNVSIFEDMKHLKNDNIRLLSTMKELIDKINNLYNDEQNVKNSTINNFVYNLNDDSILESDKKSLPKNKNYFRLQSIPNPDGFSLSNKFKKERIKRQLTYHIISKNENNNLYSPKSKKISYSCLPKEFPVIKESKIFNNSLFFNPLNLSSRKHSSIEFSKKLSSDNSNIVKSIKMLKSFKSIKQSNDLIIELKELNQSVLEKV
jgi:hypothetical protein